MQKKLNILSSKGYIKTKAANTTFGKEEQQINAQQEKRE